MIQTNIENLKTNTLNTEAKFEIRDHAGGVLLSLDDEGMTYNGELIKDAGAAHTAFVQALGTMADRRRTVPLDLLTYLEMARLATYHIPESLCAFMGLSDKEFEGLRAQLELLVDNNTGEKACL